MMIRISERTQLVFYKLLPGDNTISYHKIKIRVSGKAQRGEKAVHTGSMYAGSGNQVLPEPLCNTARGA